MAQLEAQQPSLDPALNWVWRAWHRLSDDRPFYGGGMGPSIPSRIPWTTVRTWCRHYGLTQGEMEMLDRCFLVMDNVYFEWFKAQIKSAEKPSP